MSRLLTIITFIFFAIWAAPSDASIFITEILADPPSGILGDANADGSTSSSQDEFIEIFNLGFEPVDISGWALSDGVKNRHVFEPGTLILPNSTFVIFSGGMPNLPGIEWRTSSTGSLGLNNGGDTVSLYDGADNLIDRIVFGAEGGKDQSIARAEVDEMQFLLHSAIPQAQGSLFSPGRIFMEEKNARPPIVPEPVSLLLVGAGVGWLIKLKTRSYKRKSEAKS